MKLYKVIGVNSKNKNIVVHTGKYASMKKAKSGIKRALDKYVRETAGIKDDMSMGIYAHDNLQFIEGTGNNPMLAVYKIGRVGDKYTRKMMDTKFNKGLKNAVNYSGDSGLDYFKYTFTITMTPIKKTRGAYIAWRK